MSFQATAIKKSFDKQPVLNAVTISVERGEILGLLGKCASGKSTLCRIIAGEIFLDSGTLRLDGKSLANRKEIAYVPQCISDSEETSVWKKLGLSGKKEVTDLSLTPAVIALLHAFRLNPEQVQDSDSLSESQKQLFVIARALAAKPRLLIFDDALSGLDNSSKILVFGACYRYVKEDGGSMLVAANHPADVLPFSDRVALLHGGSIIQEGTPFECYRRPHSPAAAGIISEIDFIRGKLIDVGAGEAFVETAIGKLSGALANPEKEMTVGCDVTVGIRIESWNRSDMAPEENCFRATVVMSAFFGDYADCLLLFENGQRLNARFKNPRMFDLSEGTSFDVWLDPDDVLIF